jgi:type I restriction enzyme, S subunit
MNNVALISIGELLELVREPISPESNTTYRPIGVRSFGKGIFHYDPVDGSALGKLRWFIVRPGELVVSNIKGWEGAIAVSSEREVGCIASNRFLTYRPSDNRANVHYLRHYFLSEPGLELVRRASPGSTDRNLTLGIEAFESIEIPLPPFETQRRIAESLEAFLAKATVLGDATARCPPSLLMSLLPSFTEQMLSSSHAVREPLATLADFITDTVHPGDDPGDAKLFVGLQHVERHSGRRLGGTPIGEEKGRKFRFQPGDVVYGYLRPYLNKAWVADRHGLCSVDQYVLRPKEHVRPGLLAHGLRSKSTLDEAIRLTHSLQLPRLRSSLLAAMEIPTITAGGVSLEGRLDRLVQRVCELADTRKRQMKLVSALEKAALNAAFTNVV